MPSTHPSSSAFGRLALALAGLAVLASTACGGSDTAGGGPKVDQCAVVGPDPAPTGVFVIPGRTPAVDRLVDEIETGNSAAADLFTRVSGLTAEDGGILLLVHPEPTGDLGQVRTFDLRSQDGNRNQGLVRARAGRDCFLAAVRELPQAPVPDRDPRSDDPVTERDVINAVPAAVETATRYAQDQPVTVTVAGFGRSQISGVLPAQIDLSPASRELVRDTLSQQGINFPQLPSSDAADVSVRFVAAGEGLPAHIQANVRSFLEDDICPALGAETCTVGEVI